MVFLLQEASTPLPLHLRVVVCLQQYLLTYFALPIDRHAYFWCLHETMKRRGVSSME